MLFTTDEKLLTNRMHLFPNDMQRILFSSGNSNSQNNWQAILQVILQQEDIKVVTSVLIDDEQISYDANGVPRVHIKVNELGKVVHIMIKQPWSNKSAIELFVNENQNIDYVKYFDFYPTYQLIREAYHNSEGEVIVQKYFVEGNVRNIDWLTESGVKSFANENDFMQSVIAEQIESTDTIVTTMRTYDDVVLKSQAKQYIFYIDKPLFRNENVEDGLNTENQTFAYSQLGEQDLIVLQSQYEMKQLLTEFPYLKSKVKIDIPQLDVVNENYSFNDEQFIVAVDEYQINQFKDLINEFVNMLNDSERDAVLFVKTANTLAHESVAQLIKELECEDNVKIVAQQDMLTQSKVRATVIVLKSDYIISDELLRATQTGAYVIVLDEKERLNEFCETYTNVHAIKSWTELMKGAI